MNFSLEEDDEPKNFFDNSYYFNQLKGLTNIGYFLFVFFMMLSLSGSFFQINSNFLLFLTFTFFFIVFYLNSSFFFSEPSHIILDNLSTLIQYNLYSLHILKYALLNNRLLFFKNIFIYIKSFNILVFISNIIPLEINLTIRNFLLSKTDDLV